MAEPYVRRVRYLGISLERGTPDVPDDGKYYLLLNGEIQHATASLGIAEARFEILQEEVKAANPHLRNPRELLAKESAFTDIMAVKGEAKQRRTTQEQAKGGKGGRSGV